ncbi:hypothetical protein Hanom_Chr11g01024801 [Helianthus anomalus]
MAVENLKKMVDQVLMTKALEVNSSGSENESGKADSAKTESVCKGCTKECNVYNTHVYLANIRSRELIEKMVLIDKEVLNHDKLVKASSERLKELTEKIEKDKSDVERFQKENEKLILKKLKNFRKF